MIVLESKTKLKSQTENTIRTCTNRPSIPYKIKKKRGISRNKVGVLENAPKQSE